MASALTVYKLIVLYMLNRMDTPISKAQISDFVLENGYTNFLTLQQAFAEMEESGLVASQTELNRTFLTITEEGSESLHFFSAQLNGDIKQQIEAFLKKNGAQLRNEAAVTGEYYKTTGGEYEAHLCVREKQTRLVDIRLCVPEKEMARSITEHWQDRSGEIYQFLIEKLF
ncbi:MAG: DUF4364 family protein [Eubacteriales bacterium]|nr:DUF4364 family protein [Eubacteriales bacterium]